MTADVILDAPPSLSQTSIISLPVPDFAVSGRISRRYGGPEAFIDRHSRTF
jgi:hypothetical protein